MKQQNRKRVSPLEDAARAVDQQLARLVEYVNDNLVPAAREQSELLLRRASVTLKDMADRMAESSVGGKATGAAGAPKGPPPGTAGPAATASPGAKRPPRKKA